MVKHIKTIEEFEQCIAKGRTFVDFFALWCGPCRMLGPVVDEVSELKSDIIFAKVDVDELPTIAQKYSVSSIPSLFLFNDGKIINRRLGYMTKNDLLSFLEK